MITSFMDLNGLDVSTKQFFEIGRRNRKRGKRRIRKDEKKKEKYYSNMIVENGRR